MSSRMGNGFHVGMVVAAVVCLVGRAAGTGAFEGRWVFAVLFAGVGSAAFLWTNHRAVSASLDALGTELDREIDEAVAAADAAAADAAAAHPAEPHPPRRAEHPG